MPRPWHSATSQMNQDVGNGVLSLRGVAFMTVSAVLSGPGEQLALLLLVLHYVM